MKNLKTIIVLLLAPLAAAACSGILTSDEPPRQEYLLMPLTAAAPATDPAGPTVALSVSAVPGLDTNQILALGSDARLNHYANARWADHLPEVLTSVLRRSLATSGHFSNVDGSSHAREADQVVTLEAQAFYGIRAAGGDTTSVQVRMAGSVRCGDDSEALSMEASAPVGDQRLSTLVAAHQSGLDDATRQLLKQLQEHCG
jgi:ABC-type uncharacterized transport system auxiliary subunit